MMIIIFLNIFRQQPKPVYLTNYFFIFLHGWLTCEMMPALWKRVTAAGVTVLPFAVQALKHHEYGQTSTKTQRLMLKKKKCFLIQFILLWCLIVLFVTRPSAAEPNCLWVSVMVIVWIKCWRVAQKMQDKKGFPLFFSLMIYLMYFADDYNWPLNPSGCGYGRGSISISGTGGNEHKERVSAKGWLKLQKRIWGTALLIVPTFLSSLSLSSSQLCQQASIPYWESDPRLYSASSLRNEIDP